MCLLGECQHWSGIQCIMFVYLPPLLWNFKSFTLFLCCMLQDAGDPHPSDLRRTLPRALHPLLTPFARPLCPPPSLSVCQVRGFFLASAARSDLFAHQLIWALESEERPPEEAFNPEVKRWVLGKGGGCVCIL